MGIIVVSLLLLNGHQALIQNGVKILLADTRILDLDGGGGGGQPDCQGCHCSYRRICYGIRFCHVPDAFRCPLGRGVFRVSVQPWQQRLFICWIFAPLGLADFLVDFGYRYDVGVVL